jgi:rhodanese-related sulfurtransferase
MATFLSRLLRPKHVLEPLWIEIDELRHRLASGDPVVLIDVRQPEEFTAPPGHLPGALNVPLTDLAGRVDGVATHRGLIVLVCKTDRRSAKAAEMLHAAGLGNVAILCGGTDGWYHQALPLEL